MMKKLYFITLICVLISVCRAKSVKRDKNKDEEKEEYYNSAEFDVIYDQKQNGSENWRVDLSGVDVVVAPSASILKVLLSPMTMLAVLDGFSKQAVHSLETKKIAPKFSSPGAKKYGKSPVRQLTKHISEKIQIFDLTPKTA